MAIFAMYRPSVLTFVVVFFLCVEEMEAIPTRPTGKYGYEYLMESPRKECAYRMTDYKYCEDAREAFKMPICHGFFCKGLEFVKDASVPKGCYIRYFPNSRDAASRYRWFFNEHKTGCSLKDKDCASHYTTLQEVCLSTAERLCEEYKCRRRPLWQCKLNGCKGTKFDLSFKDLTGTLPAKMDEFLHDMKPSLTDMYLDGNQLTGVIPTPLQEFKQIRTLSLYENQLTGTVPAWLGDMSHLSKLILAGSKLTGTIPPSLCTKPSFTCDKWGGDDSKLTLSPLCKEEKWCGLNHGPCVTMYCNSQALWTCKELNGCMKLDLPKSDLTGTIPELSITLTELNLGSNGLTGTLPKSMARLTDLKHLNLLNNALTGTLPKWIADLKNLKVLNLMGTKLHGPIPANWCSTLVPPQSCHLPDSFCLPKECASTSLWCGVGLRCNADGEPIVNYCHNIVCGGNSVCSSGDKDFVCTCASGWIGGGAGALCSVNHCEGIDCGGLSKCKNGATGYTCQCAKGWTAVGSQHCKAIVKPTVPQLKTVLKNDPNGGEYFSVTVPLSITKMGLHDYSAILDTGSTGMVVVQPTEVGARNDHTCLDVRPCLPESFYFNKCFADGSGYAVQAQDGSTASNPRATLTLLGLTAKVTYSKSISVYNYKDGLYDSSTGTYTNVLGIGGHGEKACTASKTDLLTDFTKSHKLPKMFSLRSAASVGISTLYIGGTKSAMAQAAHTPLVIDPEGHYVVHLSGFEVSVDGAEVTSSALKSVENVLLDTGSSGSMLASESTMHALLVATKALCSGEWVAAAPSVGYIPPGSRYRQYSCDATSGWAKHQVSFVFGSAKTWPIPVTNFVVSDAKSKKLFLKVLRDTGMGATSVLGVDFFKDNWVEFDVDSERVRFARAMSWSAWSVCTLQESSAEVRQTRTCTAGDESWCLGSSSRVCAKDVGSGCAATCNGHTCDHWVKEKTQNTCARLESVSGCDCRGCSCESSVDGQLAWSPWSACSVTCGEGKQGRGMRVVKPKSGAGVMRKPSGHNIRSCNLKACGKPVPVEAKCTDPSCVESDFCFECSSNDYFSCRSCNVGCTLRKIDDQGHHDCKGTGDWGPVKHDDGIVVVHGRKLLRHAVTSTGSLKT